MNGSSLSPRLHQAARLMALGFKHREICQKLGMAESHLSQAANSPLFKMTINELKSEMDEGAKVAQKILTEAAPEAAEKLVEIMRDKNDPQVSPRLKKEVSVDILKGAGAIKVESATPQINITLSEQKMNLILETIDQIKKSA